MTLSRALSTNNYGIAKFIVATSAANGTHTTLASALAAASSGNTVFLRDSVTENVTLPAGVNIVNFYGGFLNTPTITGTVTMTAAGTSSISGVRLATNSAAAIAVTGSAASVLIFSNCYLDFTNNTGITFSTSNAAGNLAFIDCFGNLGTTGIGIFTHTSAGSLSFIGTTINNSGGSSTASTISAGTFAMNGGAIFSPISSTSTASLSLFSTLIDTSAQNATCYTSANTSTLSVRKTSFSSGSASALSIGSGTVVNFNDIVEIASTNTNPITGLGTLEYGEIDFTAAGTVGQPNVATMTPFSTMGGGWSRLQTIAASNSASLEFKTLPTYSVYAIVFNNLRPATNAQDLELTASSNNGSTYANSGYTSGINFNAYNTTTLTNATSTTYGIMARSQSNGIGLYGTVFLTPGNGGWWGQMSFFNTTANTYTLGFVTGTSGIVFNALKFLFATGNITSGSATLYGLNT